MSYILEALKKSDQERQQGLAPGLQTVQVPVTRPTGSRRLWLYLVTAALLLNAAVLGWWLSPWQSGKKAVVQQAAAVETPPPAVAQAPGKLAEVAAARGAGATVQATGRSAKTPPAVSAKPPTAPPVPRAAAVSPPGAKPPQQTASSKSATSHQKAARTTAPARSNNPPPQAVARVAKHKPAKVEPSQPSKALKTNPPSVVPKTSRKATGTASPAPAATPRGHQLPAQLVDMEHLKKILQQLPPSKKPLRISGMPVSAASLEGQSGAAAAASKSSGTSTDSSGAPNAPQVFQLPAPVQRTIPQLTLSFLVYSKVPQDRMVSVNGKMFHEGQEVSAGLKLEKITQNGVIFSYHGHRFFKGVF